MPSSTIELLSTDFDGTFFAEFENPPVPVELQQLIADLQRAGGKWVINTGRDLSSLMETLGRAHLPIKPDFVVVVEREIYVHQQTDYRGLVEWNDACTAAHEELFVEVRRALPRLTDWIHEHFTATIYEDPYSPFCLIAESPRDAESIHNFLEAFCREVPNLTVMRNDIYARFSHVAYNKGTALSEIGRRLGIPADRTLAAGDHLNDLPMLELAFARWLVAPGNAVDEVKAKIRSLNGYVSQLPHGHGVADGLKFALGSAEKGVA
jgi:HAD superfamily hydrolase (TIGR01484 family)